MTWLRVPDYGTEGRIKWKMIEYWGMCVTVSGKGKLKFGGERNPISMEDRKLGRDSSNVDISESSGCRQAESPAGERNAEMASFLCVLVYMSVTVY